jgi:transposase-like protein
MTDNARFLGKSNWRLLPAEKRALDQRILTTADRTIDIARTFGVSSAYVSIRRRKLREHTAQIEPMHFRMSASDFG